MAGRIQHKHPVYLAAGGRKQGRLFVDITVALADSDVVDQYDLIGAHAAEDLAEFISAAHHMHRCAQHLPIDFQLFVSANPISVGCDKYEFVGPETANTASSQLGNGCSLAHAGRPHQSQYKTGLP